MKQLKRYFIVAITLLSVGISAVAQDSSSSTIMRRGKNDRNKDKEQQGVQITDRMQQFYEETPMSDADVSWMRVIYRQLDLTNDKNAPLYFP